MVTRTSFKLSGNGIVHCWCGALRDFVEDINEFIIPILDDSIVADFNERRITITCYDNADTIYKKFLKTMNI